VEIERDVYRKFLIEEKEKVTYKRVHFFSKIKSSVNLGKMRKHSKMCEKYDDLVAAIVTSDPEVKKPHDMNMSFPSRPRKKVTVLALFAASHKSLGVASKLSAPEIERTPRVRRVGVPRAEE